MDEISISRASTEDAAHILALQQLAYQSEAELYSDWSIPPLTQTLESLREELAASVVLKAVHGTDLVGSVRARDEDGTCCIGRLIVRPDCQRQGLGSRLLQAIEAAFPAARTYELFTGTRSEGNLRLYARHGYAPVRTERLSPGVELVFLRKPGPAARSPAAETARRDRIVEQLVAHLRDTPVAGVLLSGSMAYGRGHSVTADSDIDLLIVSPPDALGQVLAGPLAGGVITDAAQRAFAAGQADCMWDDLTIDDVTVNPGYLSRPFFDRWCALRAQEIRRNRSDMPSGLALGTNELTGPTARGKQVPYSVRLDVVQGRYVVTRPLFAGDELLLDPLYTSALVSDAILDPAGQIGGQTDRLRTAIIDRYGAAALLRLVDYALRRASSAFVLSYLDEVGCGGMAFKYLAARDKSAPEART